MVNGTGTVALYVGEIPSFKKKKLKQIEIKHITYIKTLCWSSCLGLWPKKSCFCKGGYMHVAYSYHDIQASVWSVIKVYIWGFSVIIEIFFEDRVNTVLEISELSQQNGTVHLVKLSKQSLDTFRILFGYYPGSLTRWPMPILTLTSSITLCFVNF